MPHVFPRGAIQTLKELERLKHTKLWISPCSTLNLKKVIFARYLNWDATTAAHDNIHLHFDQTIGGTGGGRIFWTRKVSPTVIPFDYPDSVEWYGYFFTNYWFAYAAFIKYLKSNSKEESE